MSKRKGADFGVGNFLFAATAVIVVLYAAKKLAGPS